MSLIVIDGLRATESDMPAIASTTLFRLLLGELGDLWLNDTEPPRRAHPAPHGVLLTAREDHRLGRFIP